MLYKPDRSTWPALQFWALLLTLAALFFMGGSSRADVQSLAILNPAIILCCGVACLTIRPENWQRKKWFLTGLSLLFVLAIFYLIPFPAQVGSLSQGAREVAQIRAETGILSSTHPLAIAANPVWQSVFFLFTPLAVFLFAIQLDRVDLMRTSTFIILLGVISGIIGVLQLLGSANGPLYFYRITNNGSAVGLFANRNHAAVMLACMFPLLAYSAARSQIASRERGAAEKWIAIAITLLLVPLILVTGSRSGMLAAVVGILGGVLIYRSFLPSSSEFKSKKLISSIWAISTLVGLVFLTIYFSRAKSIERIFADTNSAPDRAEFWISSLDLFWQYMPLGFGPGSFTQVFQFQEPLALLGSAYLNRLHNDWLEVILTYGIPGILLLLSGSVYFIWRTFGLWVRLDGTRSLVAQGRVASVIIAILGITSFTDYPLRTPSMMGFATLALVWLTAAGHYPEGAKQRVKGSSNPEEEPLSY
jgi:O-antigen ligase